MGGEESQQGETARATIDVRVERPTPGRRFVQFSLLGLAALAGAVFVVSFPSVLPTVDDGTAESIRVVASVSAAVVGLFGLYTVVRTQEWDHPPVKGTQPRDRVQHDAGDTSGELLDELLEPGTTQPGTGDLVGDDIDERLAKIDGRVDPSDGLEASYAAEIREQLRETAQHVLVEQTNQSPVEAAKAIKTGSWTDDRRVIAFLGGSNAPDPPIEMQLRDWASGEAFDRRVKATTAEIRQLQQGDHE
ncbi:MAG: hypothetical protein ABEH86_05030 [Haloarcula sp.]